MESEQCFHCGLDIPAKTEILFDQKQFCCTGCKTVYEIFSDNGLSNYYAFERAPGATPMEQAGKYAFLENEQIVEKLLDFNEGHTSIVQLQIPHIHCASCIWILENLNRLQPGISSSQANFPEKKVRITFNNETTSLSQIVSLLCRIGYEPYISLGDYNAKKKRTDYTLTYKLGVAFFCFGNIMLLSFPEYFEVEEYWLDHYKGFFRWLVFGLSLPSFFYSASGYYVSAWNSIKTRHLSIDIPIALGIVVMFIRSTYDIVFDHGQGFFDSLTGLVFFMLLGKMFQQKSYGFLSFERDYKSYFPVAVTRLTRDNNEQSIPVHEIEKGDVLLIRNQELIPTDGILLSDHAAIDYSFVTGEAVPIDKQSGDKLFAGGRQMGKIIRMQVLESVQQSYLTQLWSNDVFQKNVARQYKTITDKISQYFTPVLLAISVLGYAYWIFIDANTAFNVFTAVLIVACPCALALTAPFTMGNVLRIFGRLKFYLKNALAVEQLAKVDTIVFDKTGTLTSSKTSDIKYAGRDLSDEDRMLFKTVLRGSNHPLSRMLYEFLPGSIGNEPDSYEEIAGKGVQAKCGDTLIRIGSADFCGADADTSLNRTSVHFQRDGQHLGSFVFHNKYREGMAGLFARLKKHYDVKILSGDNDGERQALQQLTGSDVEMVFNQKPEQKLAFIHNLQDKGRNVMMVGDGLNDAGALAQSNIGIAVAENVNVFSPACDAILDAGHLQHLDEYLKNAHSSIRTIKMSFGLSIMYNIVGVTFALTGNLLPLVAAIIMPLSTVTIISFVTLRTNLSARKLRKYAEGNKVSNKMTGYDKYHNPGYKPEVILPNTNKV